MIILPGRDLCDTVQSLLAKEEKFLKLEVSKIILLITKGWKHANNPRVCN